MKNRLAIGPRGWAVLILLLGAALASPFLRGPEMRSANSYRLASEHSAVSQIIGGNPATAEVRVVSGILPSTQAPHASGENMPDWARPRSQLDELIAHGVAPAPAGKYSTNAYHPADMQAWTPPQEDNGRSSSIPAYLAGVGEIPELVAIGNTSTVPSSPWERDGLPPALSNEIQNSGTLASQPHYMQLHQHLPWQAELPAAAAERGDRALASGRAVAGQAIPTPLGFSNTASQANLPGSRVPTDATRLRERIPQYVYQPGLKPE